MSPNEHAAPHAGAELVDVPTVGALEAQTRGEIDIQIVTARRFPRSIETFMRKASGMATLDEDTAASCFYVLPKRKGSEKAIEGPSARLGEIVAAGWGHMRIQGRIVDVDDRFVTACGVAWDLENNVARSVEIKRRITDKNGHTYSEDMIATTANAAIAIATRNAIFQVIPNTYTRQLFNLCKKVAIGKAETLSTRRAESIEYFGKMGVPAARVFAALEVRGLEDITGDHLVTLRGLATAIREGDTTVDEAFPAASTAAPSASGTDATAAAIREELTASQLPDAGADIDRALADRRLSPGQALALLRQYRGNVAGLSSALLALDAPAGKSPAAKSPAAPVTSAVSTPAPSTMPAPAAAAAPGVHANPAAPSAWLI